MISFKSSLVRNLGVAAIATALLFGSVIGASADPTRDGGLTTQPSTTPSTLNFKTPSSVPVDATVLDDFTPARARTSGSDALKGNTGTARGGNAPHTSVDDFKGGPGCSIQCITSGIAYARGVGANLVVKTDTPAKIWIIVWNDDGYHKQVNSDAGETEFAHHFDDLEPGTFYYAMAAAEDSEGYTSHGFGDFTTLTRNVQITFTEATLYETPYGNDDFYKHVWLDNEYVEGLTAGPYTPDGDTLNLGINILSLDETDHLLDLHVELSQSDESADLCEAIPQPESPSAGSWGCTTWAHATFNGGPQDLDDRPNGATSWTEHTMERTLILPGGNALPGGYGAPLNFSVLVTLNVYYD